MDDVNKLTSFVTMGCMLQLTAGSLEGRFGEPARSAPWTCSGAAG